MNRAEFLDNCNFNPEILIDGFVGEYRWLSNFHICDVEFEKNIYPSSENAFQAAKTLNKLKRVKFKRCSPNDSKKLGREIELRKDWEEVKVKIMFEILADKFSNNKELKQKLICTGNAKLVEGNWWKDTFWGVCDNRGENNLGKLLMKLRKELQNETKF